MNVQHKQVRSEEEEVRANAIMHGWLAFKKETDALDQAANPKHAEIGRAGAEAVAAAIGISPKFVDGREEEFGRILSNYARTFQMLLPYPHQGNDSLIKESMKWISYAISNDCVDEMITHDVAEMNPILGERTEWIEKTGDVDLAMDAITTPTCFRDLVVGEGFELERGKVSYTSPYKRILEAGHKRGIWTNLTEQVIHERWTTPRMKAYGKILGVDFDISPWNEDRRITIRIPGVAQA